LAIGKRMRKKEKSGYPDNFNQVPFERKIGIKEKRGQARFFLEIEIINDKL